MASSSVRIYLSIATLASVLLRAQCAESFLQKQDDSYSSAKLLEGLEGVLGEGSLQARLPVLEARLKPTFLSLPKTASQLLSHAGVRYALHRINVDLHGWSISGLEPNETTFNTTSLAAILSDLLPEHLEVIFEKHVHPDGFSLRDLAILASTVEQLVHGDQAVILQKVCEVLDIPTAGAISAEDMKTMIVMYKALFLVGFSAGVTLPKFTAKVAQKLLRKTAEAYPGWDDALLFVDDEIAGLDFNEQSISNPFRTRDSSLDLALRVVMQIADHFAPKSAELECQEIKDDLLEFERGDTGRIRLADFYRAGLSSRFFFVETKEYLKAMGALDDTDTFWGPKVIVSNYVLSKSNCLAHSHIYSVCCINECESLYGTLERALGASDASPAQIVSLITSMSSSTVQAPRDLTPSLVQRLEDIAHNGNVRLHSRLFAQWMHQAFPRECPYPHLAGTTTSMSPDHWAMEQGVEFRVDANSNIKDAIATQIDLHDRDPTKEDSAENDVDELSMWTFEEEHFVEIKPSLAERAMSLIGTVLKWCSPIVVLGFVLVAFGNKMGAVCQSDDSKKPQGLFV